MDRVTARYASRQGVVVQHNSWPIAKQRNTVFKHIERNRLWKQLFLRMTALFVLDAASYVCIQKDTVLHKNDSLAAMGIKSEAP